MRISLEKAQQIKNSAYIIPVSMLTVNPSKAEVLKVVKSQVKSCGIL